MPWRQSTGPKTEAGKALASMNAYKHGARSALTEERVEFFEEILRIQSKCLDDINRN